MLNRLLIDLSWNSSRLEGNTYSLLDTERLISLGEAADNKTAMEAQIILNHKDAIEFLFQGADDIGFNRYTILNLRVLLSNKLLPDPAAPGRLRQFSAGINRSVFTPLGVQQQIEEMFELILEKASQIEDPFEQALFVMVQLPYLQPFDDVNKRVSRLSANIPFKRNNLVPLSFIDVPNDLYIRGMLGVYELNRIDLIKDVYMWAYERSSLRYSARSNHWENLIRSALNIVTPSDRLMPILFQTGFFAAKLPAKSQMKPQSFLKRIEINL
jgi:hypothetical protein